VTSLAARYLDGTTSRERPVRVRFAPGGRLHLEGAGPDRSYDLSDLAVRPRMGDTPRAIDLPGGARLEIDDNDAVDAALADRGQGRWHRLVHALERRRSWVTVAVALTFLAGFLVVGRGVPWLADHAARAIPTGVDARISAQTLEAMDRTAFQPSALPAETRRHVTGLFDRVVPPDDPDHAYRLAFRAAPGIGANAFALPSGTVVITDDLVNLAQDDGELLGVLAHEVGHVVNRHALRQVLADSAATLLIASVTGDIVSTSTLAAGLPVALLQAHHSRAFETEADTYALAWMRAHGVAPRHFADLLGRLEAAGDGAVPAYLSSHPATQARIARFTGSPDAG
jgi:Zn-dependent protease with chaperone function